MNQRLREADLAMATTERVFAKHIAGADANRMLILTAAVQSSIAAAGGAGAAAGSAAVTVRGQVDASRIPVAAQAPAFRRIARPQRQLVRGLTTHASAGLQDDLIGRLNATSGNVVSAAPPPAEPGTGVTLGLVAACRRRRGRPAGEPAAEAA